MTTEIRVPTLGESVTEATVAKWLKQPGESVAADEPLVELETDKVTLEVNAPAAGVLSEVLAEEGANVEVDALLGRIGEGEGKPAENKPAEQAPAADSQKAEPAAPEPAEEEASEAAPSEEDAGGGEEQQVVVPTLGESVAEASVAKWLKQEGDSVGADEPLVELETDKVSLEVNAPVAGVLTRIDAAEGATVGPGEVLGSVTAGGAGAKSAPSKPAAAAEPEAKASETSQPEKAAPAEATSSDLDPSAAPRSGEGGKITARDLKSFLESAGGSSSMTLSPAVANLVAEHGLDPARIPATGPKGRLTKEDVLAVVEGRKELLAKPQVQAAQAPAPTAASQSSAEPKSTAAPADSSQREERVRMTKLRQTIARRLKEAQNTAAMLTTFNEVDMSAVMALRSKHKEGFEKKHGVKLGFTSFFAKAVVAALKEVPAVNARIDGDEIVYNKFFDIGMAVSTPQGLMVPIIRDCDGKSFAEIESSLGEIAGRARDGKLKIEEMQGGSFTITNGGVFGSLLSTPILNAPQSGILGLHKIQERPMAVKGQVEIRPMMYLAHSYDHRIVDGREAVTFLIKVKEAIEDPERLLLDL
ncbi:2-oxoglutarate dehydrogenase complex dihydrolipoyllysine-residue succinyltransferase [Aquibaculum arenosum]|uniref:Dihydrolipoyllysine-residue succinyltransferase n=1 Tax=Aquibaculum arenosum TaxID=3032591 RepID=A0ABT5YPE8_9PROT|nr:2-oxoglutarate dehydrogenase complex dihydrolipoyllysine-residue succinyltransferase [Fodinicurvata sp. CAU 1616]MDF2096842.1 2-oxoglutarate dehydrogenase complex dihydrolipoyllysine-residue succinyltransferase [Fodinicurvata sp. CAU 1616]